MLVLALFKATSGHTWLSFQGWTFPHCHVQDMGKMDSHGQKLPHEGPQQEYLVSSKLKKLRKVSWDSGCQRTSCRALRTFQSSIEQVTVTGWEQLGLPRYCGLSSTVVASQGAIYFCQVVDQDDMIKISRGRCGFALHSSSRSSCSPRVTACPEALSCNVASSSRVAQFWTCLLPCKSGCNMAKKAEIGGNTHLVGDEGETVPYLGRLKAQGWEEQS